jgi:hypothetical protein
MSALTRVLTEGDAVEAVLTYRAGVQLSEWCHDIGFVSNSNFYETVLSFRNESHWR